MLHKKQCGLFPHNQLLQLHPGIEINVVQRLIPHVQMGTPAQTDRQQQLLFLPVTVTGHIHRKKLPWKIQLPQHAQQQRNLYSLCSGPLHKIPLQKSGVLGHIGDFQSGDLLYGSCAGFGLTQQQTQKAGFPAAIPARQADPLSRSHLKVHTLKDRFPSQGDGYISCLEKVAAAKVRSGDQLQCIVSLHIPQQALFFLDSLLLPAFQVFGPFHQLGCFMAYVATVRTQARVLASVLGPLHPFRPISGAADSLLQAANLPS